MALGEIGGGQFSPGGHCHADRHSACVRAEKHVGDLVIRPDAAVDEFMAIWRLLRDAHREPLSDPGDLFRTYCAF